MKRESLSKNMILQFMYQGLILVIPLILSPYLTRTLQETALGIYSYTNSIAYYFVILSMLGINRHGQRIISQNVNDSEKLRKVFWSLFAVHIIISLFCTLLYLGFILFLGGDYKIIYLTQTFYVLSAMFDITWLFYGLENFKSVVIKNAFVKIFECILIFVSVHEPSDLWKYSLITACGILFGQIFMIPQAIRQMPPIRISAKDCSEHIKPLLVFSISVIAVSLYTVFDKTLLGIMSTKENVAFYEYSNRIITIPKTIIGVIGTVMFPRACKLANEGDVEGQKKYIDYSFLLTAMISMAAIFGLFAIGKQFAVLYYGKSFSICGTVIKVLSPLIFIIGIGDIIRTQFMIPNHMDKQFNICILLNAIININLSISLIPVIGIYGAVVGTIFAEIFGLVYQMALCRKFINIKDIINTTVPFIIIGIIMYVFIKILILFIPFNLKGLLLEIIFGGCAYLIMTAIYFCLFRKDVLNTFFRK